MTQAIQSAQNPQVRHLKALMNDAKLRREEGVFLIEGPKLAADAMASGVTVLRAVLAPGAGLRAQLLKAGVDILELGEKAFDSVAGTDSPQGVILVAAMRPGTLPAPGAIRLAVAAERLQDPGNLGTLLRCALACAADAVYLGPGCADAYAPKTLRAASGAQWQLGVEVQAPLEARLSSLKAAGVQVLALDPRAKDLLWDMDLRVPSCFVLGSEGQGLGGALVEASTCAIKIAYPGKLESLNAGVSLSIALFEALRQRR
jgi:TrmH family RNA methyltransferase